jgi:hypothetical protein
MMLLLTDKFTTMASLHSPTPNDQIKQHRRKKKALPKTPSCEIVTHHLMITSRDFFETHLLPGNTQFFSYF